MKCWCGSANLGDFSETYLACYVCGTLVSKQHPTIDITRVQDDESDFYGRKYWFSHQAADLGFPDIVTRARADLPERCVHWLGATLKHKLPPGKVLELGSGSGAFVALLGLAGFEASGLELSPWVVDFSRNTFGIQVLLGPVEDQDLELGSFDVIAAMDVLEHLPDPVGTMKHCLRLLKSDGILILQTPCRPEAVQYEDLVRQSHRFVEQLKSEEHLYLFSESSIQQFFSRLGAKYLSFDRPIFMHYDMFLVVSQEPIAKRPVTETEAYLLSRPQGRFVQSLIDARVRLTDLLEKYEESQADRSERLRSIQELETLLAESERDRAARLSRIKTLEKLFASAATERVAALEQIKQLEESLVQSEADRAKGRRRIEGLESDLADLMPRLKDGEKLLQDFSEKLSQVEKRLTVLQTELEARSEEVDKRNVVIRDMEFRLASMGEEENRLRARLALALSGFETLASSKAYRAIRRLGRWRSLGDLVDQLTSHASKDVSTRSETTARTKSCRPGKIAVDLTPILPGGQNGGAKLVTIELVNRLAKQAQETEWILLTSSANHSELAYLEGPNVKRLCVSTDGSSNYSRGSLWRLLGRRCIHAILSPVHQERVWVIYSRLTRRSAAIPGLLTRLRADLLFCPFTAPLHFDPGVPAVSLVHDLQYRYYPQFFSAEDRQDRDRQFLNAARLADKLICVSDYVRQTVLDQQVIAPERVVAIQSKLFSRLPKMSQGSAESVIEKFGLQNGQYLIYPANLWEHKNHRALLVAFGIYLRQNPGSDVKLVLTGDPCGQLGAIERAIQTMGLEKHVRFLGFLPDIEFSALLECCLALIFPSLYEGFGLPVLEAMARGKPVLCSNVTSLPEVAGEAAILFDPRRPKEIAKAIQTIVTDSCQREQLVAAGLRRVAAFGDADRMAREYWSVFEDVWQHPVGQRLGLYGVFADGWTGENLTIRVGGADEPREVEVTLCAPDFLPHPKVSVRAIKGLTRPLVTRIERGETRTFRVAVEPGARVLELAINPTFRPRDHGINNDDRRLACICRDCRVEGPDGIEESIHPKSS